MIRRALPGERSGVVATVTAAFAKDPGWAFILGEEYERLAAHFVAALFDVRVASQNVWVTDDLAAVAMWDSPGKSDTAPGHVESVWARYHAIAVRTRSGAWRVPRGCWGRLPAEPHWYLGVLATHPAAPTPRPSDRGAETDPRGGRPTRHGVLP